MSITRYCVAVLLCVCLAAQADTITPTPIVQYGASGAGAPWSLRTKPAVADSRDEEFEGAAYTGWTKSGTDDGNIINVYDTAYATAAHWRGSWNSFRPGYFCAQQSNSNGFQTLLFKSVTLNTNDFIYSTIAWAGARGTGTPSNHDQAISIGVNDGAGTNAVILWAQYSQGAGGTGWGLSFETVTASVHANTYLSWTLSAGGALAQPMVIGIHKLGTTYHFYWSVDARTWYYWTSVTQATTMNTVLLSGNNGTATAPGVGVVCYDYVRFIANATNPP